MTWSNFRPASMLSLRAVLGAIVIGGTLFSAGCSNLSTVLDAVMIATAAAPGAVIALEAAGTITPDIGTSILNLAQIVNQDCSKALMEAGSTDAPAQMAAAIAADFANVPTAIPGMPPAAAAITGGILAAVDAVLVAVGSTSHGRLAAAQATKVKKLPPGAYKIPDKKFRELKQKVAQTDAAIAQALASQKLKAR